MTHGKLKDGRNNENISVNISDKIDKFELLNAKLEELEKWMSNHVYEVVSISLNWVKRQ